MSAASQTQRARADDLSLARFWAPRHWPMWAVLLALHGVARLPFGAQLALGRGLGRGLQRLRRREERIARANLELCFPELGAAEREALLDRHHEAIGISLVEMAIGWFTPLDELRGRVSVHGREHLDAALARGRGALLFGAHFTTVEVGATLLQTLAPRSSCMYRPQRNPMLDVMIRRGRSRFAEEQIPSDNVRALIKRLRDNHAVLYFPDQTYLGRQSVLLPFFGVPALTNTATSKLAALSGAAVLTYFFRRLPGERGYRIDIGAPLPDFPSDDPAADTRRLFALLEDYIRLAPEQYLWLYKKFKGRPPPYPDPYRDAASG